MPQVYRTHCPKEALDLALEFKRTKKFDLFRGQNEDWPLIPSVYRLPQKQRVEAAEKLFAFSEFLSAYKFEEKDLESIDYIMAIAQHYGIPTEFVDLTYSPKVAMFFATHSNKKLNNKEGVILCINKDKFNSVTKFIDIVFKKEDVIPPFIYEPKIASLWRLKAQQGCFLQLTFADIESWYGMDKIIFPHNNECLNNICETDIYPENKSDLELIIDNYFAALRIDAGAKRLKRFSQKRGIKIVNIPKPEIYKYAKSEKPHKSWNIENIKSWEYKVCNPYSKSKERSFNLEIHSTGNYYDDIDKIEEQLTTIFKSNRITKRNFITPSVIYKPKIRSKKISTLINKNVKNIWDGMRTLPYSRKKIIYSISKYLASEFYDSVEKIDIEELFHIPILIELCDSFGAHCRCLISRPLLQWCLREDILDIQSDSLPKSVSIDVLHYIQKTELIFNFNELVDLFYKEIIPSQVLRSKNYKNPTLFFTPAYVDRIGFA